VKRTISPQVVVRFTHPTEKLRRSVFWAIIARGESKMSTRERWIVYPLLFLALGAALRDKLIGRLQVGHVICDRLESGQSDCRALIVRGPNGRPVVEAVMDAKSNSGAIGIFSAEGVPLVQLESPSTGGVILLTGHIGQEFGVFARLQELGSIIPVAVPWRYDGNRADQPPRRGMKAAPSPTNQPPEKPAKAAATKNGTNNKEGDKNEPSPPPRP
jgi:hypothetical protein